MVAEEFLGLKIEGLSFEVLMNGGSLIGVLVVYKKDILRVGVKGVCYVR